jgi:predicted small lipoprotein YifL
MIALAIMIGVAGCGRRGALEAPPGTAARTDSTAPNLYSLDGGKRQPVIAPAPPREPFILDPLL